MHGLRQLRVIDFSTEIAGPYCTKLLTDAGADVLKVEAPEGDPLRHWSATGAELADADGALFCFLNAGKRSIVGRPDDPWLDALIAGADLVVESFEPGVVDGLDWLARHSSLTWLSITPFGRGGPWAHRPWSEFTLQAESGSIGTRGLPGQEPFQAGGRITEWVGGTFAAVGALAAAQRARRTGHGEHVDFSLLEVMNVAASNYMDLFFSLAGRPDVTGLPQTVETPSIEPSGDGYVGFCTNSNQQFQDFLLLIGRPDLRSDKTLSRFPGRMARLDEWSEIVHAFTRKHTTAEIVERAATLRIPVAPVNNGDTEQRHEQLVARGVFWDDPTGRFRQPRPPYKIPGRTPPPPRPAPNLGQHDGCVEARVRDVPIAEGPPELPLCGVRILDMTNWWAGPSAAHMLATLGADVIHVESIQRIDGMRTPGGAFAAMGDWWERSPFFLAANSNKRGLTLKLTDPRGVVLAKRLIARSDVVIENFTPRVMANFGLDWETIHALNPRAIFVRMPAFGLDGPWRDHTGFAQTMEQLTGLAWLTGHADDQPRIQRGPCDPLAGMHASFATLVALSEREVTGEGALVECTMVECALNAAAEQLIEFTAYGNLMQRDGNRCPEAAPQGLYPCRGHGIGTPRWLALSVRTDAQWRALRSLLPAGVRLESPELATRAGRRTAHDRIDAVLRPWIAERDRDALIDELVAAGIPAARVADPRRSSEHPQLAARGFHERVSHPIAGSHPLPTLPFRYASVERWIRRPAPTLGQHNREILGGELGLTNAELAELEADGIIGARPQGI